MNVFGHHHHHDDDPMREAPAWAIELYYMALAIIERTDQMATKEQIDKLMSDVTALIDAGVAEITAAVAAAKQASTDPAIDALDTKVTAATQALKDAAAALAPPPAAPTA